MLANATMAEEKRERFLGTLAGKHLTFRLASEEYGIEILKVQEIIKMQPITRVPRTAEFVLGVINLRGKVIPIVDLRIKFRLPATESTQKTCVIVVETTRRDTRVTMGIVVDEVLEVSDIVTGDVEPPPELGNQVDTAFILGIAKTETTVRILLDIDRILSAEELSQVSAIV